MGCWDFRKAFPDLNFWGAADLIAEGDYILIVGVDLSASAARIALMRDGLLRMSLEDFQAAPEPLSNGGFFTPSDVRTANTMLC
jgi:hypothetical protein